MNTSNTIINPTAQAQSAPTFECPASAHAQHLAFIKRTKPATPCSANHINFGGGCFNCGFTPKGQK